MICKKSQRSTAVFLQEAREQVIIEQSIKICEKSNTVMAKYPFLRDPVQFLTKKNTMAKIKKIRRLGYIRGNAERVRNRK